MSSYNHPNPIGSQYSSALIRPYAVDSFALLDSNVEFNNISPKQVQNKNYRIASNVTLYLPSATSYFSCGNFNMIKNEINNLSSEAKLTQKYYFTPSNTDTEYEYVSKTLLPGENVSDTIPIRSNKYRMEIQNNDLTSNAKVYINNTISYFSQFDSSSHSNEVLNNPVNHNQRLNNAFYDDVSLDKHRHTQYKNITGFIQDVNSSNSRLFWDVDQDYLMPTTSYNLSLDSDDATDTNLKLKIDGLDIEGKELTEYITLDGTDATTPVNTSNTFLRVNSVNGFIDQPTNQYQYTTNGGNISVYVQGSSFGASGLEYISQYRTVSNTIKYAVPLGKEILIKSINVDGVCGFYDPKLDLSIINNILYDGAGTQNIIKKVFTTRFQDNQNISQEFKNLNIKVNELQEFYMEFNPLGTPTQDTYLTCSINMVEYPKQSYF